MLQVDMGNTEKYCDGMSRRSFVQLGVAGMATAGLADVLRAKETAAEGQRDRSVILLWLDGGPGHLDLYDLKPEAPAEIRGMWNPIPTNVPGFEISELFPQQAKIADKFSIVRSLHHGTGDHFAGGHRMLTSKAMGVSGGNKSGKFPSLGSVITRELGAKNPGMPSYISVPVASSIGLRPGYFGGNWLGVQHDPFQTGGDPNKDKFKVKNLNLAKGLSLTRLEDRRGLLTQLDTIPRNVEKTATFDAMDRFDKNAFEFVSGKSAREAFDLSREDPRIRDLYGRHTWGQSTLLARRLVEAGARFVTCHFGGWDSHWDLESRMNSYLPRVDAAVSGLFKDLEQRGLLESTMVVLCGEFSRTPRINDGGNGGPPLSKGTPGRDHWGASMFCLMGGGGIRGGQIIGSTDSKGYRPLTRAVRPEHIHATIYKAMGLNPALHLLDHRGRPTPVLEDPTPISELL
ncbi:hypothetical protein Mal52_51590 [Symmachiella dynata]|uniref:DUF1501 domain-containing protein n=1 Tax=Symmachiella dynata TaxID=2527995 RepID=A0A517ZVX1_9PLAN|nr:DUF1501 domain-containing protein [Symmachiella dynata]QDU46637.1 hypothetical protein Mal52_51590 [Symmachiella dynata]